jgi:hypothetical protein
MMRFLKGAQRQMIGGERITWEMSFEMSWGKDCILNGKCKPDYNYR